MARSSLQGHRPGGRRARVRLSRGKILEAATDLARREGREAITMRAVAEALGTRPMSLYSHVRNKDDLLAGVAERALDRLALEPRRQGPWDEQLRGWMHSLRRELLAAPELMPLFSEVRYGSPQVLRTTRLAAEILVGAGYEPAAAAEAAQGLLWGAFGFSLLESPQRQRSDGEPPEVQLAAAFARMSDREREKTQPFLPHFATRDFDSLYDTFVRNLIAGLESRLGSASGQARPGGRKARSGKGLGPATNTGSGTISRGRSGGRHHER